MNPFKVSHLFTREPRASGSYMAPGPGRPRDRKRSIPSLGLLVALLGSAAGVWEALRLWRSLEKATARRLTLEQDRRTFEAYLSLEATLRERQAALERKEAALAALRRQQLLPARLLEGLVNGLPSEVWFKRLTQKGSLVTLEGEARSLESIHAFFDNLRRHGHGFQQVSYPGAKRGTSGSFEFTLSFELQNGV